jgi:MoaA/NifB/PqqE/SkfB family radical SAM enzyme
VDLRWTNHCNQACVYCGPEYSSKWAQELDVKIKSNIDARTRVKDYVFANIKQIKNVYLAGGEPLLMNENKVFLEKLLKENPKVSIRVNTNLSSTRTGIFDLLCKFKNVHWTVSVEAIKKEYEYIRYHGSWKDFLKNLKQIQQLDHKITFNMLYFILNYKNLFLTVDFLKQLGFHENSFVIGPLYTPEYLNILNLPNNMLDDIKKLLSLKIKTSEHYLKNSYQNILKYISDTPWNKNIVSFRKNISILDNRRNQSAEKTFPDLFKELNRV